MRREATASHLAFDLDDLDSEPSRPAPGKVSLTQRMPPRRGAGLALAAASEAPPAAAVLQADRGAVAPDDPFALHLTAQRGVSGGGGALPHLDQLQTAFGHHDLSGVKAHVGGAAASASAAIGAAAYATGNDVAFAAAPDLRQAAHEAAHVVQQRGGVRLDGGVGAVGDVYEQHADAVADLVTRGESAESLLDTMAHRGAAGGPAVQLLVSGQDTAAIGIVQRLLADAHLTATEARRIAEALVRAAGEPLPTGAIRAQAAFSHRGEPYALMLRPPDALIMAQEALDASRTIAARPRTRRRGGHRGATLTSLHDGGVMAGAITALAGAAGDEQSVELTVRVPIAGPVHFTGQIALEVAHSAEGYQVSFTPTLGFGLSEGDDAHLEALGGFTTDVSGSTPAMAADLILVALDHTLRAMGSQPPPTPVLMALAATLATCPWVGVSLIAVDLGGRFGNWLSTGEASDPFFVWLADLLFGAGHIGAVRRRMGEGDSVETADSLAVAGEASRGEGRDESEISGSLGGAHRWSLEGEDGGAEEHHWETFDFAFEIGGAALRGLHGSVEGSIPLTGGRAAPAGAVTIELGATVAAHDLERVLSASTFARVASWVADHFSAHEGTEGAVARVSEATRLAGEQASAARDLIMAAAEGSVPEGGDTEAEIGIALELEIPLRAGEAITLAVKMTDELSGEIAGEEVSYAHARTLHEFSFGGRAAGAPVHPDGGSDRPAALVHAAAAAGVAGPAGALPHAGAIQTTVGHHDGTGVRAHVGGAAAEAAAAIGAGAYATGDDVAFAAAPDLRQAAHEAAHVVQQRGGVRLDGGVGRAGDPYEQHADAVAALVVRGDSAETLLDTMAHRGPSGGPAVQRDDRDGDGIDDDVATLVEGHTAASLSEHRTALTALTAPQLEAVVAAIQPRRAARAAATAVYQVWFGNAKRYVLGSDLAPLRGEANARARTSQATVESHQDWGRYSGALEDAAPEHSSDDDPARATAIRAVAANSDLDLHDSVVVALWRECCAGGTSRDRGHGYFTRTLTDAMAARGVPNGVLDQESVHNLRLGDRIVPASTSRYGAGAIASLTAEQLTALIARLGAPEGSITRTERRHGAATVTVAREFWVAASEWQVFALAGTGRAPNGQLSREDLERLVPGLAAEGSAAAEEAGSAASAVTGEAAEAEAEAPPGSSSVTAAQRAQIEAWRHDIETTRTPPAEPEPAAPVLLDARGRPRRPSGAERATADRARRGRAAARTESINAALATLTDDTVLPGMQRLGVADWSPAQMLHGSDTVTRWVNRVFTALGRLIGAVGASEADSGARSELERGGYVTGAATLRRTGWDPRLSTGHFETDEEGHRHRVIDETPEERAPDVVAALTAYRALVTRLNAAVDTALTGVVSRPDESQRAAAVARFQAALRAIAPHIGDVPGSLQPPPSLIRHSIRATWPRACDPDQTEYAALLQQVRSWDAVFNGLLAHGRRDHTSLEEGERATAGYGAGITNVNPDAVFVDLHRTGVEITNNHGNALSPDEARSGGGESSDMSMHLDPVFALNMSRFLEGLAGRGVTRMWTSGFLRSAMSPADTHPMGMACDVTGFTFGSGHVIHLRNGQPVRDHGGDATPVEGNGNLPQAPSGPSAWFDDHHLMEGRPYSHIIMGLTALMPTFFDRIIGPGANADHMAHWHVENSPNGAPRDGLRLHAVSSESTHVPEFMRDAADHRSDDWASAEPIPLTVDPVLLGPAATGPDADGGEGATGSAD